MSGERPWFRAGVAAFIWRPDSDTYLLVRRSAGKNYAAGEWWLVTGTVEANEGFAGALEREVIEELGSAVADSVILETTHFNRDSEDWLSASFLCTLKNPDHLVLNAEHDAFEWVNAAQLASIAKAAKYPTDWVMTGLELAERVKKNLAH